MTEGYEALRRGAAWMDLSERGRIVARGRDRARFLHNVTSNDIKKMTPGSSCYAFLLSPQGRIQADLSLICFEDRFLIDTEPELREKVRQQILRYKVADQVDLEDVTETTASVGVEGPDAGSVQLAPGDHFTAPFTVTGQPGFRIYCSAGQQADLIAQLERAGVRPATAEDARLVRIENGKPVYGEDIRDTSLPQETQQMQGVSFTKGCYIGQEIVERIRARGHVNRKLERIELEGTEAVAAGTILTVDGREAEVTSSVFSPQAGRVVALAYVKAPA
jgi:tRNA-modifying protein YgfZ